MANNRGISSTEFIAKFTTTGGTVLQSKPDGTCIFLNTEGCGVHSDRPLVCRLYPLGRHVNFLGVETFSQMESEQGCKGGFHESGTVLQYLEEQGAAPFMHAADLYLDLLWQLLEILKERDAEVSQSKVILNTLRAVTENDTGGHDLSWIDMDVAVADYCRSYGVPAPTGIEEKMAMHIKAVKEWAA